MSVEQGDRFLSQSWQMRDAFEEIDNLYPQLQPVKFLDAKSFQTMQSATHDYVFAGISWLANRSNDPYLEEIGTTAWWVGQQRVVPMVPVNDIQKAAFNRGFSKEQALSMLPFMPLQITQPFGEGNVQVGAATVLLPFNIVFEARKSPIQALAKIASMASQMSDYVNDRYDYPNEVAQRGVASYAHILDKASRLYDDFKLRPDEQEILEYFPDGIDSLPDYMRSPGINGNQISNFRMN